MAQKSNMLSATRIKMHGMVPIKWTTNDKITQYKGLIKLYTRDKKIMEMEHQVYAKKQYKELKTLQDEIERNRYILYCAIQGNKQKIRTVLQDHKELQMTFQNSPPTKIREMLHQVNFKKRKDLDKFLFKSQQKAKELVALRIKYGEIQSRLRMQSISWQAVIPEERIAQRITAKVKDTMLKKEAAMAIKQTYKMMIDIMKKDSLYFDAVLITLRQDGINQSKCMLNAIKLGQLASEYLDDRKQEFEVLEKIVRRDMLQRKKDLNNAIEEVENFAANAKYLLRRDSDINLGRIELEPTASLLNLKSDLKRIECLLYELKYAMFIPNFEAIYPCLKNQRDQKERLEQFVKKLEMDRDNLVKKEQHARLRKSMLGTSITGSTLEYKAQKKALLEEIAELKKRKVDIETKIKHRQKLLAKIRIGLKHLQALSKITLSQKGSLLVPLGGPTTRAYSLRLTKYTPVAIPPEPEENDGARLIPEITKNFTKLLATTHDVNMDDLNVGFKLYEQMIHGRTRCIDLRVKVKEDTFVEEIQYDAKLLTREDIKKQSAEIVAINSVDPDLIPVRRRPRRRFKF